jgi:MoaA/NifB/PqqE/SkfB family radical SAM enzyme
VRLSASCESVDPFPREVVVELTTRRATRPVFTPAGHMAINRPDLSIQAACELFDELAATEDVRLTFGGVGDPLLAPRFLDYLAAAQDAGIRAIHCRTDLLDVTPEFIARLAAAPIDVISIHIPAITARTYLAIMGVDGLARVLENVKTLVEQRWSLAKMLPILVPVFTKCRENLAEMETWYDKWLAALGSAVIAGPSDFAGQIPDHAVADMRPPARRPCNRLASRLHVLSNGAVVPCEQDACGKQALGQLGVHSIEPLWAGPLAAMRDEHRRGHWNTYPLCSQCKEWHRP